MGVHEKLTAGPTTPHKTGKTPEIVIAPVVGPMALKTTPLHAPNSHLGSLGRTKPQMLKVGICYPFGMPFVSPLNGSSEVRVPLEGLGFGPMLAGVFRGPSGPPP